MEWDTAGSHPILRPTILGTDLCGQIGPVEGITIAPISEVRTPKLRLVVTTLLVSLATDSCRTSDPPPAGPSSVDRLTIAPAIDTLKVSDEVQLSATIEGRPVPATWSSSAPEVLLVESGGRAVALRAGLATLSASSGDRRVSRVFRVVPDFAATWNGFMRMTCQRICQATGETDPLNRGTGFACGSSSRVRACPEQ
jgi:hypothetical protein